MLNATKRNRLMRTPQNHLLQFLGAAEKLGENKAVMSVYCPTQCP